MTKFIVSGFIHGIGETDKYVEAESLERILSSLSKPDESGLGFVRYSVSEVESFPDSANMCCPKCSHSFLDPGKVLDLT
jgi:hypothetical protein